MKYTEKDHFLHHHTLTLERPSEPFVCNGCKILGFEPCYLCKLCNFHLHEHCANAEETPLHPSPFVRKCFSKCRFHLHSAAPQGRGRYCDVCCRDVQGLRYQCQKGKHDLHPCCMNLPYTLANPETGMEIRLTDKARHRCLKCRTHEAANGAKGWCYVSSCGELCYHVACIRDMAVEQWKQGRFGHIAGGGAAASGAETSGRGEKAMVKLREGSRSWWRKASKVLVFIRLVLSAIFGDPTALIFAVAENLF